MKTTDAIYSGAVSAHNVLKARGVDVGMSLVDTSVPVPTTITKATNVIVPIDALTEAGEVVDIRHVGMRDKIVDIGPATVALIAEKIKGAKTVIMNGPLGLYEEGHVGGTKAVLKHLSLVQGQTIVGIGDTVCSCSTIKTRQENKLHLNGRWSNA